jgi:hypothetical protein
LRLIIRRSPDGHQTPILTSRNDLTAAEIAYRMSNRWRQENYFKDTREHFALDALDSYADPYSPWQRPTNENSNGLIRDYYPKGTDFTHVPDTDIVAMQDQLNRRPRKVLDYATPAETLHSQLVLR